MKGSLRKESYLQGFFNDGTHWFFVPACVRVCVRARTCAPLPGPDSHVLVWLPKQEKETVNLQDQPSGDLCGGGIGGNAYNLIHGYRYLFKKYR